MEAIKKFLRKITGKENREKELMEEADMEARRESMEIFPPAIKMVGNRKSDPELMSRVYRRKLARRSR